MPTIKPRKEPAEFVRPTYTIDFKLPEIDRDKLLDMREEIEKKIKRAFLMQQSELLWPSKYEEPPMTDPPNTLQPFFSGDRVKLKTGNSPIRIMECAFFRCHCPKSCPPDYAKRRYGRNPMKGWYVRFAYESSLGHEHEGHKWREAKDFEYYEPQEEKEPMPVLYQTKEDKPRFGTLLTKNSKGKMVLEMKGKDGDVEAFDPEMVEEVLPYTVGLRRFEDGQQKHNRPIRHYIAVEGDVEVGNILMQLTNGNMWEVMEVDTKKRDAQTSTNGFIRLATERLTVGREQ